MKIRLLLTSAILLFAAPLFSLQVSLGDTVKGPADNDGQF